MSHSHRIGTNRVYSLDTIRGLAMVLVIWQHMLRFHVPGTFTDTAYTIIPVIAQFAPVAFMFISGTALAYIFSRAVDWGAVYARYVRRAVMFILIAHPVIRLAGYYSVADTVSLWQYLTLHYPGPDTVAFVYLTVPLFIRRFGNASRVILSLCLLIATPIVVHLYNPDSTTLIVLKEVFFGQAYGVPPAALVNFPLLPWLAVGLIGTVLGEAMGKVAKGELAGWVLTRRMNRVGVTLAVISVILVSIYVIVKGKLGGTWDADTFRMIYPRNTSAFLPFHLALLLWTAAWLIRTVDTGHRHNRFTWLASVFGRTSLFCYATQWAVATSLPTLLGLRDKLALPEYIGATVAGVIVCWMICYWYGRWRGWIAPDDYAILSGKRKAAAIEPPGDRQAQISSS